MGSNYQKIMCRIARHPGQLFMLHEPNFFNKKVKTKK